MIDLSQYIYQLLRDHECVVVPGLGGFITRKKNATVYVAQNLFVPPSKHLLFNSQLTHNDGVLVHFIARNNHDSYENVLHEINESVNDILYRLYKEETITLDQVGNLRYQNGFLRFEESGNTNIQDESYGLNSFIMPLLQTEKRRKQSITLDTDKERHPRKTLKSYQIAAAITFLLLSVGAFLFQTDHVQDRVKSNLYPQISLLMDNFLPEETIAYVETGTATSADFLYDAVDFYEEMKKFSAVTADEAIPAGEETDELSENSVSEEILPENELNEAVETSVLTPLDFTQKPVPGQHYIIIGSFHQDELAEKLCRQMRETGYYSASILDIQSSYYHRVSLNNFDNLSDAQQYLRDIQQNLQQDAWILNWKNNQ